MIVAVAVRYNGKVYSLPRPNRHHDVLRVIHQETGDWTIDAHGDDQGFLDENGTYYRRAPALIHAITCGQIKEGKWGTQLYSEDVW